jgi:hypothetical protein
MDKVQKPSNPKFYILFPQKVEEICAPKTLVNFYQTTYC